MSLVTKGYGSKNLVTQGYGGFLDVIVQVVDGVSGGGSSRRKAYYKIEYLFTVNPGVFDPPPKVDSAVIRLIRNDTQKLNCDEALFFRVVKQGFQNRRKTLRNALKPLALPPSINEDSLLNLRAEHLAVSDFVLLTQKIEEGWKN